MSGRGGTRGGREGREGGEREGGREGGGGGGREGEREGSYSWECSGRREEIEGGIRRDSRDREEQGGDRCMAHTLSILPFYRERAKSQLARQQSGPTPQPFEIKPTSLAVIQETGG